jgi:hypothetical protein
MDYLFGSDLKAIPYVHNTFNVQGIKEYNKKGLEA